MGIIQNVTNLEEGEAFTLSKPFLIARRFGLLSVSFSWNREALRRERYAAWRRLT